MGTDSNAQGHRVKVTGEHVPGRLRVVARGLLPKTVAYDSGGYYL